MNLIYYVPAVVFVVGFYLFVRAEVQVRRLPIAVRHRQTAAPFGELLGVILMSAAVVVALIIVWAQP